MGMFKIILQLHGGGGGGGGSSARTPKQSAPGSTAAATIATATDDVRQQMRERLAQARGRRFTDKTGSMVDSIKKQLLGE
jgi:hypothetical protein